MTKAISITPESDPQTFFYVVEFFRELADAVKDELAPKFQSDQPMIMDFSFNRINEHRNMRIIIKPGTKKVELYALRPE